nr:MerR family transcriptional regulator [candidate division Zixibacteria bacterium]
MIAKHPIRVVSKKTGLSPHLIRIWERRYRAILPERSSTNQRLYSDEDIEKLKLLHQATESGESISQIAGLSTGELRNMLGENSKSPSIPYQDSKLNGPGAGQPLREIIENCIMAIHELDSVKLEAVLLRASVDLSQRVLITKVIQPLMYEIGNLWARGSLKIVHEHLASAVIRTFLGEMMSSLRLSHSAPVLIATTPRGQTHEFGAMIAAILSSFEGWRPIYLGPDMPADDIAHAANTREAPVVILSIVYPLNDPLLVRELRRLKKLLNGDISILAGGRGIENYRGILAEIGAIPINDLDSLITELKSIRP